MNIYEKGVMRVTDSSRSRKSTKKRLMYLQKLLKEEFLGSQKEIVDKLREAGFNATQSTISRDLKRIGAVRVALPTGEYRYMIQDYAVEGVNERVIEIIRRAVTSFEYNSPILLVKVIPGTASAVARAIESLSLPQIAGSVAGDDTIFFLLKEGSNAAEVVSTLQKIVEFNPDDTMSLEDEEE